MITFFIQNGEGVDSSSKCYRYIFIGKKIILCIWKIITAFNEG